MSGLSRFLLAVLFPVLVLVSPAVASAAPAPPPKNPEPAGPPTPAQAEAIAKLPPRQHDFLDLVGPLISAKERAAFLGLPQDYQRDAFMRRFWEVRDPIPKTPRNEFREAWEERAKMARERFGNLTEDRALMLLWNGPPGSVLRGQCDALLPLEIWSYDGTERLKGSFSLVFVAALGSSRGPYRLWYPNEGLPSLLAGDARVHGEANPEALLETCPQGSDIAGRLGLAADWSYLRNHIQLAPQPGEEWLTTFLDRSTDLPGGAPTFPAQVDITFPGRYGSRTVVQTLVTVAKGEVTPERLEKSSAFNFMVDGEILYQGELFDSFRYRFNLPEGEVQAATIPLVFQRYLRPGDYRLVLKIEDTGGKRWFRQQRDLEIPAVQGETAAALAAATAAAPSPTGSATAAAPALAEANAAPFGSDERSIRILAPPPGLITGKVRLEAMTTGPGIAKVRFNLNGKPVLTKGRPPYSVELNLGDAPKIHTLQAVALGANDDKLAEDEILLNTGPHRFSIRLVEPQRGKSYQNSLRAQAQVEVPQGDALDRVELYLNDALVATLYQPPYVQPVLLPPGAKLTYVRAVAYLKDGNSTEDLVIINAPDYVEEVNIDFVELFTTVVDSRGRPVEGLEQKDFTVLEDGAPQTVRRFELVRDLPIYAGILLDTSASMGEHDGEKLKEAVNGGLRFFEQVIKPKDRAAVFTFNDTPTLAVRFTNQIDALSSGLNGLKAEGNTALYDSLIYSLYYFGGIKGKKAIVLLSDGQDSNSHYKFDQALDYARRSGVSIYAVGIALPPNDFEIRAKLQKMADETGGRAFFVGVASELGKVFETVEKELRSQYLLAYQSPQQAKSGGKFRSVEVKMSKPGLEAKTIRGYFP
jgi:Ca-activated chloride channel family protein